MNTTNGNTTDKVPDMTVEVTAAMAVIGTLAVIGLVGNVITLCAICLLEKMRTPLNLCLASLAIVDLTLVVFLPLVFLVVLYDPHFLGKNVCYFLFPLPRGTIVCSSLTFLLISAERYTGLCRPLQTRGLWSLRKVCLLLVAIWAITLLATIPDIYVAKYAEPVMHMPSKTFCHVRPEDVPWHAWYDTLIIGLSTFLPIPILIILYTKIIISLWTSKRAADPSDPATSQTRRSRPKVIRMLILIIFIYILCCTPLDLVTVISLQTSVLETIDQRVFVHRGIVFVSVRYLNHVINPVIYMLMSSNIREAFIVLFCKCRK